MQPGVSVSAGIQDVAPTLLYLLEERIPVELEGRVLLETIDGGLLERRPPEYEEGAAVQVGASEQYATDDSAVVEERLRGLGYIE